MEEKPDFEVDFEQFYQWAEILSQVGENEYLNGGGILLSEVLQGGEAPFVELLIASGIRGHALMGFWLEHDLNAAKMMKAIYLDQIPGHVVRVEDEYTKDFQAKREAAAKHLKKLFDGLSDFEQAALIAAVAFKMHSSEKADTSHLQ